MKFPDFANNSKVVNVIFFVSVLNVLGYLFMKNYDALVTFILFGMMTAYFSKDLAIILGVPLVIVNALYLFRNKGIFEGMENKDKNKNGENANAGQSQEKMKEEQKGAKVNEVQPKSSAEGFGQNNKKQGKYRIDYATTLQESYQDLNNVLGNENMKKLTKDTQDLLQQQQQLTKAMEGMAPLVEKLVPMMKTMGGFMNSSQAGGEGVQNLSAMMSQLGGK